MASRPVLNPASPRPGAGFTLIELLVSIGVIAVLIGIMLPALGSSRAAAHRVVCAANLRSIGTGVQLYVQTHDDLLPRALPLDDSAFNPQSEGPSPDSILAELAPLVDSAEVFICPADEDIPERLLIEGPVGRHSSYEYWAGWFMLFREVRERDDKPEVAVTKLYEDDPTLPVLADSADRHPRGPGGVRKNALYFQDWRADWLSPGALTPESP